MSVLVSHRLAALGVALVALGGEVMVNKIKILFLVIIIFVIIIQVLFWYSNKRQILYILWYRQQYGEICSVTFSPDNRFCFVGGTIWDKKQNGKRSAIYVYQSNNGILKFILKGELGSYINHLSISPNGKFLASSEVLWRLYGTCGTAIYLFKLWQLSKNGIKKLLEIYNEDNPVFSPDGKFLATCSGLDITLWQIKKNSLIKIGRLTGHELPVTSIAFSSDSKLLASGDVSGTIKLWRLKDRSLIFTLKDNNDYISSLTFSPNGIFMITGYKNGFIKFWYIEDNSLKLIQKLKKHKDKVYVLFSPNGKFLLSCSKDNIIIWAIKDAKLHFMHSYNFINNCSIIAFSSNNQYLAIGTNKGEIYLFCFYEKNSQ